MTRLAGVALALLLVAGCGGGDDAISRRAARQLDQQVDLVEFAITAGRYEPARRGIDHLREEVARHADAGRIGRSRALRIFGALEELETSLVVAEAP